MFVLRYYRLPFNWQTPRGYLFTEPVVSAIYFVLFLCLVPTIGYYAGSCALFITFVEDITNDLKHLNIKKRRNQNWNEMRAAFCKIIQLHSEVKQLSEQNLIIKTHMLKNSMFFF